MLSHPELKNLNRVNVHVINNGIPISDPPFNDLPNEQFNYLTIHQFDHLTNTQLDQSIIGFCQGGFTIGSIGRLSTEKGYRYLIDALALLIKENIDARLVIIGEGYERDFLEDLTLKSKLKDRALIPGYRDNAKQYLPYFNVFVISSLTEGLPITLLEAMQAKVPIVATKVGGIPDALSSGEAGLLVESQNPKALSEALFRIYKNSTFGNELANKAYRRLYSEYSSQNMASGYFKIYQDVIHQNSR